MEVYATPEPRVVNGDTEGRVWRFAFRWSRGGSPAALVVSGDAFGLFDAAGTLWRSPALPADGGWIESLTRDEWVWLPDGESLTGADLHADGRLLVRTDRSLVEFPADDGGWGPGRWLGAVDAGGGVAYGADRARWSAGAHLERTGCGETEHSEPQAPPPPPAAEDHDPVPGVCAFDAPYEAGRLEQGAVSEASGMVASRRRPGVFWLHNDSGDGPRLYAAAADGTDHGSFRFDAGAEDFEDIAAAPCPDGSGPCLWVGDIGDNYRAYAQRQVYMFREPDPWAPLGDVRGDAVWRYGFTYPDGPRDAEALVVDPDGRRFAVVEKRDADSARVFTSPVLPDADADVALSEIGRIETPEGKVTGADLGPRGLLIRSYTSTRLYAATRIAEIPGAPQTWVGGQSGERQGESVAWDPNGGFWTVSEDRHAALHHAPCR